MRQENYKHYFCQLIEDGQLYQNTDINGIEKKPKLYFSTPQICILVISIVASLFASIDFGAISGYLITSLSLLVGLLLTLMVTMYGIFRNSKFKHKHRDLDEQTKLKRKKTFIKQFTAIVAYSILISLLCILLLLLSFFIESYVNRDFKDYSFILDYTLINKYAIYVFISNLALVTYRAVTVYFYLDFLFLTLYSVVSMYSFIKYEYDSINVSEDESTQ